MSEQVIEEGKKVETTCPNCKEKYKLTINKVKPDYEVQQNETKKVLVKENNQTSEHTERGEEPKKFTHEDLSKMIPKGVNFATCPDGNCGATLKNARGLSTKFKTCPNCERNAVRAKAESCPFCNNKKFDEEPDIDDISEKIMDDDEE